MQSRLGTLCIFALAVALLSTGCGRRNDGRMAGRPAVAVLASKASRRTVPNQLHEIGRVEAFATIEIKSRVEGHLVAIHFKEGDLVAPGQLLFSLDPRPGRAALDQAAANLAKDEAQARLAITDEQRYAYLMKQGVGSVQQYDQAHAAAGEMDASIAADRAAVETARLNLQYAEIRSPIDGYTGNLQSHIGDLIKPDADNPMVTITKVQPIYVDFSVAERELPAVRTAMATRQLEVDAELPNSAQATEHGVLSFVNNTVDTTTGTILLKGLFQNENRRLWPGTFVNVSLTLNQIRDAIVIPTAALQISQQGTFVFVVGENLKVRMQPVVTGATIDSNTVIKHGLDAGETVVTDGQLSLAPGAAVALKQAL